MLETHRPNSPFWTGLGLADGRLLAASFVSAPAPWITIVEVELSGMSQDIKQDAERW